MNETPFFTSSYSGAAGACVKVAFRKSSYSGGDGECLEVAAAPTATLIRDTKHRDAGHLPFGPGEWAALLLACR